MNRLVYFEQIAGSARKFYLTTEDDGGSTFTANYGRIGTTGSVKTYPMSKWQHVYNTRIQHGYTDKTRDYLAGRTSLSPKTKPCRWHKIQHYGYVQNRKTTPRIPYCSHEEF